MNLLGGMSPTRYWVGVTSKDQVDVGVAGGFCQFGTAKESPLKKLTAGDWIVCYAPRLAVDAGNDLFQSFAAVGQITDDAPYSVEVSPEFKPFRRAVRYEKCECAPVVPMIPSLLFIRDKRLWGVPFRAGVFDIPRGDFMLISRAMLGRIPG